MPAQVAIVHGWSDSSKSFADLRDFLVANGYKAQQIWLGDYVSMDDDVRVEDAAKRMHQVVLQLIEQKKLDVPFDLIVHSTGGLLAREWIVSNFPDGAGCLVKRLIMLAPANFGSRLAAMGKSLIGRVAKGWNNWFQTGTGMLNALELASPYQWNLARRDLFDADGQRAGPYGIGKVWPFVITGSRAYASGMRQIVNEDGADGTVRVVAANLNAVGLTIDFSSQEKDLTPRPWHWRAGSVAFPLAVLPDRNHSTIVHPGVETGAVGNSSSRLGELILEALACGTDDQYAQIQRTWDAISESTAKLADNSGDRAAAFLTDPPSASALHEYFQIFVSVRDDHGDPVDDYFLEFYSPDAQGYADTVWFQTEVLEHTHVNGSQPSMRCLFIDRNDLMGKFYYGRIPDPTKRRLALSISATNVGRNVRYFDALREGARGEVVIHEEDGDRRATLGPGRLRRNSTHMFEIIIPRQPVERVFKFST